MNRKCGIITMPTHPDDPSFSLDIDYPHMDMFVAIPFTGRTMWVYLTARALL